MSKKLIKLFAGARRTWVEINALLYDTFRTADAAPITSPRTAEPGPGTLTFYDTGNHVSVAGGSLVIDGGESAYANPGFASQAVTPEDGLALFLDFASVTTANAGRYGWDHDSRPGVDTLLASNFPTVFCRASGAMQDLIVSYPKIQIIVPHAAGSKDLHIMRGGRGGLFMVVNGRLIWASSRTAAYPASAYAKLAGHTMALSIADMAILPLASYNPAWGGDWTEVLDSKSTPAFGTAYSGDAGGFSTTWTFTYEASKYVNIYPVYLNASNWLVVQAGVTDSLIVQTYIAAASGILLNTAGVFSDGTEYTVTASLDADGLLTIDVNGVQRFSDSVAALFIGGSAGRIEHTLVTNDLTLESNPYPALGIATSRVICPQTTNTYTHYADFIAEIKNVTLPSADNLSFQFRISGSDELTLNIASDGSIALLDNATSRITAGAGTVSTADTIVLVCDGAYGQIFVAGASVGTTSAIAHLTGTAGKRFDATTGVCDHIACFPRDVSSLLPKGVF